MSQEEARYQSLASCGAVLIAFIGVCHEFIGHIVFPWAPALLGGPVGWHGLGLFAIASGLLSLSGTLRFFDFPVVPFSLLAAAVGAVLVVLTAMLYREFHMFALAGFFAGIATAYFHRKAVRQAAPADALASRACG
jgi:hypothetical protein